MAQLYLSALPTLFLATLALGCGDTAASTAGGTGGGGEAPLGAFANPEVVTIDGWTEDAMEPFLSRDGSILFFNDSNAPNANTNLHWATRVDDTTFSYVCGLDEGDNPLTDPSCWIKANPLLGVTITEQYLSARTSLRTAPRSTWWTGASRRATPFPWQRTSSSWGAPTAASFAVTSP